MIETRIDLEGKTSILGELMCVAAMWSSLAKASQFRNSSLDDPVCVDLSRKCLKNIVGSKALKM